MSEINLVKMLEGKIWWSYIHRDMRELLKESALLLERVEDWEEKFHDYAFIVFPSAKAYEGFLKTLFLDMGFIDERTFKGKRFRIGKALNPSLDRSKYKNESVYEKLVSFCNGPELADELWKTWKHSRNLLFHWFPKEKNAINYNEAKERVFSVFNAMDLAYKGCKIKLE